MKASPLATPAKAVTKAQDIHSRLFEMATALGPNAKLPTVQQMRRDLGVSITTLDSVLKQLETQNVIYRRQGSGIFVSPRLHQKCVGLVCEPAFFSAGISPFWQELIECARRRAEENGESFRFYLALRSSNGLLPLPDDLLDDISSQRLHGVLFLGNNDAAQEELEARGVPCVVFAGRGRYGVEIDTEQLIGLAANHLFGLGCCRPALLCHWETRMDPPLIGEETREMATLRRLLEGRGLQYDVRLMWDARTLGSRFAAIPETHQEQGYQAVMHLFDGSIPPPDSLLSMDDMMTRGALAGLARLGLTPGQDVQVVSHCNRGSRVLSGEDENISFVEIDPAEIVSTMFSHLEKLMDQQDPACDRPLVQAQFKN